MTTAFIYLASGSPRRHELIQQLGLTTHKLPSSIDETPHPNEAAQAYTERMAQEKSRHAQAHHQAANLAQAPILTADTSVALNGQIFGKPTDAAEAVTMLSALAGNTHQVITVVGVFHQGQYQHVTQISDVTFAPLTQAQIERYVASGEPMDKAGAYGIQGLGGVFVSHLSGSFTGVMGLPLFETVQLLKRCGLDLL
ncbi:MAG: septum formation inhibitor Maf [Neisseriaceae bacterium]|nr:septum formation inhibitor Maf [Neisseriaceae bacterium]MBP6862414.1 septum formation inhibitor Maf [Neisseriaceae bacterium]